MRVLQSITAKHTDQVTKYPSEPILACAAAMPLHRDNTCSQNTLSHLHLRIESGVINARRLGDLGTSLRTVEKYQDVKYLA